MVVRNHGNWGHGLRPGMSSDLNCSACRREDAELSSQVRQQAAAERARQERRPVYDSQELITVTKLGPDTFELGRWDQEEEDYVHAITLSRQEAADLIYVLARAFAALPE